MRIIKCKVRTDKSKLYKRVPNNHEMDIRLFGASELVGFFVVTKELKDYCEGYMGTVTHEEYKAKKLQDLNLEV